MCALQKKLSLTLSLFLVLQASFNLVRYLQEVEAGALFGGDFACFWDAAVKARLGDFAAIYQVDTWRQVLSAHAQPDLAWYVYPPFSLFGLQLLGAMSYVQAVAWWSLAPLPLYVLLIIVHARRAEASLQRCQPLEGARLGWVGLTILASLTAPLLSANLFAGQTGAVLAVLFLAGTYVLPCRLILAGILIGLIAIKPQLGLLFPFALAAAGVWRTIAAAAVTIIALSAASLAWVGQAVWVDYLKMTRLFSRFIAVEYERIDQLALAPYVSLRSIGAPVIVATAAQAVISVMVVATVIAAFRRAGDDDGRLDLRLGLLSAGALLSTPYALTYETPLLVLAAIPLFVRAWRRGWPRWELAAMMALVVMPYGQILMIDRRIPFGLVALLLIFGVLLRRYLIEAHETHIRAPAGMSGKGC